MAATSQNLFKRFFDSEKVAGLLLLCCTLVSLVVANSAFGGGFTHLIHQPVNLSFEPVPLHYSIEQLVNDGLMAVFFLLVGLEVKREMYVGELAEVKKAVMPIAAAVGGMIVPSFIHFIINRGTPGQPGFAIPMATDIAFALGILALAGNRVPTSVKVFLSALAIIDDIGAIIVIAFFYAKGVTLPYLFAAMAIFVVLLILNRLKVKNLLPYLLPGIVMWYCFLQSGVHPTLSGVLIAFAIPFDRSEEENISSRLQSFLHKPVAFLIVPVFAIVNTAIVLPGGFIESISGLNSLGIILGLFVGKVAGIVFFPWLLSKTGAARLQEGIDLRRLIGVGFLGGIGFTMSMFISNLAFDAAYLVVTSKLSILVGSALSAVCGFVILRSAGK